MLECLPDVGLFVGGVLELQHHQRQAIEKQDDVGAAGVMGPLDGKLVDGEPVVSSRIGEVGEPHIVAHRLPAPLVLDFHPAHQQAMEGAVGH